MHDLFRIFAHKVSQIVGSPYAFLIALLVIVIWLTSGPIFHFTDTWQLIINTATTIITFLIVFLIQNTQNRDAKAIHLKLDELIHSTKKARNEFIDIEDLSDEDLEKIRQKVEKVSQKRKTAPK